MVDIRPERRQRLECEIRCLFLTLGQLAPSDGGGAKVWPLAVWHQSHFSPCFHSFPKKCYNALGPSTQSLWSVGLIERTIRPPMNEKLRSGVRAIFCHFRTLTFVSVWFYHWIGLHSKEWRWSRSRALDWCINLSNSSEIDGRKLN